MQCVCMSLEGAHAVEVAIHEVAPVVHQNLRRRLLPVGQRVLGLRNRGRRLEVTWCLPVTELGGVVGVLELAANEVLRHGRDVCFPEGGPSPFLDFGTRRVETATFEAMRERSNCRWAYVL